MMIHSEQFNRFPKPAGAIRVRRRGFSLAEMLIAIFLLGIGIISIATLFPVGLTQQRRSTDDLIAPTVANNAFSVIQSKVSAQDFGHFFDNDGNVLVDPVMRTIRGDFTWRRPAFYRSDTTGDDGQLITQGSIDIFFGTNTGNADDVTATELPYNTAKHGNNAPPRIIITQEERYFPQQSAELIGSGADVPREAPQYVWDCAFRRFQGRIYVAIFVYRVQAPGGETTPYQVAPLDSDPDAAPLPVAVDLDPAGFEGWNVDGEVNNTNDPSTLEDDRFIPGTNAGDPFVPYFDEAVFVPGAQFYYMSTSENQGWQIPGQWLLDQNNNVHRILAGRRQQDEGPVELTERIPALPDLGVYDGSGNLIYDGPYSLATNETRGIDDVVKSIWYIPPTDNNGWSLTPVYLTVKELK